MDHALCMIGQRQGDCGDVRRAPDARTRRVFFFCFLWKKVSFSSVDSVFGCLILGRKKHSSALWIAIT
jgi:hypothetical protein